MSNKTFWQSFAVVGCSGMVSLFFALEFFNLLSWGGYRILDYSGHFQVDLFTFSTIWKKLLMQVVGYARCSLGM